jgi:hypothetical protein
MKKQGLSTSILSVVGMFLSALVVVAQDRQVVRVPEGNGRPILTDGIFSTGEWDDALKMSIRPNVELLLKKNAEFIFIGIKYIPFRIAVIDLFISPDGKTIHQLHASAQLGERILNETPGISDDPEFVWGDTAGWYGNEIRWSEVKVRALMKEGKSRDEAQMAALYKYDGFEFQIRQSKFGSREWLVHLATPMGPDWTKTIVFPEGTDAASTAGWLKLVFE